MRSLLTRGMNAILVGAVVVLMSGRGDAAEEGEEAHLAVLQNRLITLLAENQNQSYKTRKPIFVSVVLYNNRKKSRVELIRITDDVLAVKVHRKGAGTVRMKIPLSSIAPIDLASLVYTKMAKDDNEAALAVLAVCVREGRTKVVPAILKRLEEAGDSERLVRAQNIVQGFREEKASLQAASRAKNEERRQVLAEARAKWTAATAKTKSSSKRRGSFAENMKGAKKGRDYYVSVDGKANASGGRRSPWDLVSALSGEHDIPEGAVIWIREGIYKFPERGASDGFVIKNLNGTRERPIHISAEPGARVTLDGGLTVNNPTSFLWLWNLEITVSENTVLPRLSRKNGGEIRPNGGLNLIGGENCKYINLNVHDNSVNGVGFWLPAKDSELYGCIIAGNGSQGPRRTHGHCIYTQNAEGSQKLVSNCIMWVAKNYGCYSFHAYTEGSKIMNYRVKENIVYHGGSRKRAPFLVGGGKHVVKDIHIHRNFLYGIRGIEIGQYTKVHRNKDCHVVSNFVVKGNISISQYELGETIGNTVVQGSLRNGADDARDSGNHLNPSFDAASVFLLPNKYDPNRAHLVVYNWKGASEVTADFGPFMQDGQFELRDPLKLYEKPLHTGSCSGGRAAIPMAGKAFGAYIVLAL